MSPYIPPFWHEGRLSCPYPLYLAQRRGGAVHIPPIWHKRRPCFVHIPFIWQNSNYLCQIGGIWTLSAARAGPQQKPTSRFTRSAPVENEVVSARGATLCPYRQYLPRFPYPALIVLKREASFRIARRRPHRYAATTYRYTVGIVPCVAKANLHASAYIAEAVPSASVRITKGPA